MSTQIPLMHGFDIFRSLSSSKELLFRPPFQVQCKSYLNKEVQ